MEKDVHGGLRYVSKRDRGDLVMKSMIEVVIYKHGEVLSIFPTTR